MKAGFYDTDITPAMGSQVPASYSKRYASGVRDPLKARAAVFTEGQNTVALIGLDTGSVCTRIVNLIREAAERKTDGRIKSSNIMIAASHTHSGGSLCGLFPNELEDAPPLVKKMMFEFSISSDPEYERLVVERASDAVFLALTRMNATTFSFGSGQEGTVSFCRQMKMKNGRTFTHPGKGNPDIVGPASPNDPEVGVIGAWREDNTLAGCVVNFTCHATAWQQTDFSADWIASMEQTIRAVYGQDVVVVFLNGAAGDIGTVNNMNLRKGRSPEEKIIMIGTRIGAEVVKVLAAAERGDASPVVSVSQKITIQHRVPTPEKVKRSRETVEQWIENKTNRINNDFIWAKEILICNYIAGKGAEKIEIQAVQIGPTLFLANPSEYFCSLGLTIKAAVRKRFPFVYVVELANGSVGYVPGEKAFGSTGGGYETRLTGVSNLEPRAGEIIAEACIALAEKLEPGAVPMGPQVEVPGKPWAYGNQPPEIE